MKKTILLFVLTLWLNPVLYSQSWHLAYNFPFFPIQSGCFIDQNNVWVVGGFSNVGIYKSTDGGITWVNKYYPPDTSSHYGYDISFVNSTTLFVGCGQGKILKTSDGGDTWTALYIPKLSYSNTKIHFFDTDLGYSLATTSSVTIIYKTTNGGTSWDSLAGIPKQMEAMDFYNPTTGVATGGSGNYWYTTNGTNWKQANVTGWPSGVVYSRTDQWGVKFISATNVVSCGWGTNALGLQPTIFLKSTDGGANWICQVQPDQYKTYVNFKSLYFKDQMNGIAVGGSTYPGTIISKTTDGGVTWIPLPAVSGFSPDIVIGYNDKVIVGGGEGDLIMSTDFGNSWNIINKYPGSSVSALTIINNNIYAVGNGGIFFKSTNAGATFDFKYLVAANKSLWNKGIFFLNENLGYACSQRGQIIKTTNGGDSWFQVAPDTNVINWSNNSIYFINENVGFVVGYYGNQLDIVYKTTDAGATWTIKTNQAYQNLNGVAFADDMHGAAVGNKSVILYTTDQGVTWNAATVNTTDQIDIKGINFYDGLNGIAAGLNIILKTTDGGANWNRITVPVYAANATLNSVCHDASGLYIAGDQYCLKSTDAGNSWFNIMDTVYAVSNSFTSSYSIGTDKSGYIWIGGYGIMTNSPVTSIKKDSFEPYSISLEQNYPNPFNPNTNIKFTINKSGLVTLRLFDVLGRQVKMIYNGEMTSGQHIINFNADNLASGIYMYTLQFNNNIISHKMTLLK